VIYDRGNGPRPLPPFISLDFIGGETPGSPNYSKVKIGGAADGEQYIRQYTEKAMTMTCFGQGAIDLLETIKASTLRETYINMLAIKNLVIPRTLGVVEGPKVRGTETENSASFDFYVSYIRVITDSPGWIEDAEIGEEIIMEENGNV
jgi:hypothetical protein